MAGNGDKKQRIEYAEICKTIKHKARDDIRNDHRTNRGILYTELCDREQNTIIHTDPKEIPEITPRHVEAAL